MGCRDVPQAERPEQLTQLSEEQGRLAELALKLSQPIVEAPDDDPEKLPDVRKDNAAKRCTRRC